MCPDKKRPAENTCRIFKGLDAVWAHFCPSKPCLPLLIDGIVLQNPRNRLRGFGGFIIAGDELSSGGDNRFRGFTAEFFRRP